MRGPMTHPSSMACIRLTSGTTRGTDVPYRGETGEQRLPGVHDTAECRIHRSLGDVTMNPISFEIAGQMDVHVGEAGEKRHVSQLDHLGVGRRLGANGLDAVTRDDHGGGALDLSGPHIQHAGGMDEDGLGRRQRGCDRKRGKQRSRLGEGAASTSPVSIGGARKLPGPFAPVKLLGIVEA